MQVARAFRWWTPHQLDQLALRLDACWRRWLQEWCAVPGTRGRVECRLAWDCPHAGVHSEQWTALSSVGVRAWWCEDSRDERTVCTLVFGSRRAGDVGPAARAVAHAAAGALEGELAGVLGVEDSHPSAQVEGCLPEAALFKPWSGAVIATLHAGDAVALRLLLDAAEVARVVPPLGVPHMPPGEPLVPLDTACLPASVVANVRLQDVAIDLGALAQLRVGDVIPTTHALADPLRLHVAGHALCAAFLGRRGEARAVELASLPHD